MKPWKRLGFRPFETATAVFVIWNAVLTFFPQSKILSSLWNLIGISAPSLPFLQIMAGMFLILGLAFGAGNLEASGLVMLASMFTVRGIVLISSGEVSVADLNNIGIATLIILSCFKRLVQIIQNESIYRIEE